ncbi:DinB family protein [Rhodocytophaga rosea]|uniref:DinB family protein n=1 Tax=Rhodocytophaga rosea TaxID=2704465 RepID=A0A6C0GI25_9BACT|nr:DinB family protein [Rhodocytophaga rosea]QHT67648.1 DinB family protein [Rhodocytophaga rosea]
MKTQQELFIKMVLDAWNIHIKRTDDLFNSLSDEQLMREASPGRNRGIYLLGHLTAIHDKMLPLLGLGESLYPELYELFVTSPDKARTDIPSISDLKLSWKKVNSALTEHFSRITPDEWFRKHNAVSEDDFAREPHRNKLNLIINRTNHLANHLGQLIFLKPPNRQD